MAQGSGMPAFLSVKRSAQSGTKVMTAAWATVYEENCTQPYYFSSGHISLALMAAGDTINIRIQKVVISGGAWILHDQMAYTGAHPPDLRHCRHAGRLWSQDPNATDGRGRRAAQHRL
jgi:hypothetical protein